MRKIRETGWYRGHVEKLKQRHIPHRFPVIAQYLSNYCLRQEGASRYFTRPR